jgi:hypothetical protein
MFSVILIALPIRVKEFPKSFYMTEIAIIAGERPAEMTSKRRMRRIRGKMRVATVAKSVRIAKAEYGPESLADDFGRRLLQQKGSIPPDTDLEF